MGEKIGKDPRMLRVKIIGDYTISWMVEYTILCGLLVVIFVLLHDSSWMIV